MKSLKLLPLLALPFAAHASPERTASLSGGAMVTDSLEVIGPAWVVLPRFGYYFDENIALELGVGFQQGRTRIGGRDVDGNQLQDFGYTGITPRLDLVGRLWNKGKRKEDGTYEDPPKLHPTLAAGIGTFHKFTADDGALGDLYNRKDTDFLANAGPGLVLPLGPLHLRTDFRWVLSLGKENFQNRGDQFINWEWTAGIGFSVGGVKDKDRDGIVDADDACVDAPEDMDQFEDEDGCPDEDNDGDGLLDGNDQCPDEAEDKDEFQDDDGCPDPDNDGDGVLDGADQCPDTPKGRVNENGCPDQDGDGIVDDEDECADEAGPASAGGCPDDDEDRVPNYRDECPDEPGPKMADPKRSDGCPAKVFVTDKAITITEKIFFDTGKTTIKKQSNELLDAIHATLVKYPGIKKVSIEGHTDNVGKPASNQTLSEGRAKAVLDYLVGKGIDASRLESKGFGQTKPLVDGDAANTDDGRAQNRRVEFNITEQEQEKVELKRPNIELVATEAPLALDGLTATSTSLPKEGIVTDAATCKVKATIDGEGKVTKVRISECIGVPRIASGKAVRSWTFEPYKDGAITTVFTVAFKDGGATVTHDKKAIKPLE